MAFTIQLIGDSITACSPTNQTPGPASGFRQPLVTLIDSNAVPCAFVGNANSTDIVGTLPSRGLHDGVSGYKVLDITNWLIPSDQLGGGGTFRNPDLAMIHIGTNDCGGGLISWLDNFAAPIHVVGLMMVLKKANPGTSFAIFKIPPIAEGPNGDTSTRPGATSRVADFNAQLSVSCDQARQMGIDVRLYDPGLTLADINTTDGVHPTDGGYAKIANAYFTAIQEYAARTPPFRPNPR